MPNGVLFELKRFCGLFHLFENYRCSAGEVDLEAVGAVCAFGGLVALVIDAAVAAIAEIVGTH